MSCRCCRRPSSALRIQLLNLASSRGTGYIISNNLGRNGVAIVIWKSSVRSDWVKDSKQPHSLCTLQRKIQQYFCYQCECSNFKRRWPRKFYAELHFLAISQPKSDMILIIGDWNARIDRDKLGDWQIWHKGPMCQWRTFSSFCRTLWALSYQ